MKTRTWQFPGDRMVLREKVEVTFLHSPTLWAEDVLCTLMLRNPYGFFFQLNVRGWDVT